MNTEIGARWIAELESGRWQKGNGLLHRPKGTNIDLTADEFCCLGVLCRMAIADGVEVREKRRIGDGDTPRVVYDGTGGCCPGASNSGQGWGAIWVICPGQATTPATV